jgi:hypothetical protein
MVESTPGLLLLLMLSLPMTGGNDLLDFLSTEDYWKDKGVELTVAALAAELRADAGPDIAQALADLGSDDFFVRERASRSIRRLGARVAVQLEQAAKSNDAEVAERARHLLRQLGEDSSLTIERRLMAIRELGELGQREALPHLQKLVGSDEPFVDEYARHAIATIEGRPFGRPLPTAKELEYDVMLLPRGCGVVGQLCIREHIPLTLASIYAKIPHAGPGGKATVAGMAKQVEGSLATMVGRIGNARLEAITFAVAGDIGPRSGFIVVIARGQYDRRALAREFAPFGGSVRQQDGIEVIDMREVRLVLASDRQLAMIIQPPGQKSSVADDVVAAVKAGKGGLAGDAKIVSLVKQVDRSKPAWAVASITPAYQKVPALAGFEYATMTLEQSGKGLAASLTAKGKNADETVKSLAKFYTEMAKVVQEGERAAAHVPALKPVVAAMKSLDYKLAGDRVTLTASASDVEYALVLPVFASSFRMHMSRVVAPGMGMGMPMPMPAMMPMFMPVGAMGFDR